MQTQVVNAVDGQTPAVGKPVGDISTSTHWGFMPSGVKWILSSRNMAIHWKHPPKSFAGMNRHGHDVQQRVHKFESFPYNGNPPLITALVDEVFGWVENRQITLVSIGEGSASCGNWSAH